MKKKLLNTLTGMMLLGTVVLVSSCEKLREHFEPVEDGPTLAFPGAEGFGRYATGARGHESPEIYVVTNLNDSGPGSFRDAVSRPGRFVVFAVGGIINLQSRIVVPANTTIAGQTAPGDGVVFYGRGFSFSGSNNTIARYLRIRCGWLAGAGRNEDAVGIANGDNMIFDHLSVAWGIDEVFSMNGSAINNITLQNSIIAQGVHRHNHSAGGLMEPGGPLSIIRNLYISNKTRNPKVKGINEFVNNVVYNFGNEGNAYGHTVSGDGYIMGGSAGISEVNIVNNYFIAGPHTPAKNTPFSRGTATFSLYASGNFWDDDKDGVLNGSAVPPNLTGYPGVEMTNFQSRPYDYPYTSSAMGTRKAFDWVVQHVGANYPKRDELDELLVGEVSSLGTEAVYVYTEADVPLANGGLGEVQGGEAPTDSDGDGIPDAWEDAHGLNKHDATDALAKSKKKRGYLNIEVYINSLVED